MAYVIGHYRISQRRACSLIKLSRSTLYHVPSRDPRPELRRRMKELAQTRIRYGYRRLHVLLKREGWRLGRKQCYRIYREEGLQLRSKLPKPPAATQTAPPMATQTAPPGRGELTH